MSNPNAKGRPRLQRGKKAVRVTVTLPAWLARRLKGMGMGASATVRAALIEYLTARKDRS